MWCHKIKDPSLLPCQKMSHFVDPLRPLNVCRNLWMPLYYALRNKTGFLDPCGIILNLSWIGSPPRQITAEYKRIRSPLLPLWTASISVSSGMEEIEWNYGRRESILEAGVIFYFQEKSLLKGEEHAIFKYTSNHSPQHLYDELYFSLDIHYLCYNKVHILKCYQWPKFSKDGRIIKTFVPQNNQGNLRKLSKNL